MRRIELFQFSADQRPRVSRNASWSIGNEALQVRWAAGAPYSLLISMIFLWSAMSFADVINASLTVVWVLAFFGVSCAIAALYSLFVEPSHRQARERNVAVERPHQGRSVPEIDTEFGAMTAKTGG